MDKNSINNLLHSACYSHPVQYLKLLETHISWVILTGGLVYKIKKPVNLGFLDFTTLEKRKYYCEEEIRLNKRFNNGIYLEVVSVTGSEEQPRISEFGKIIDYAVKMKEFNQARLMDTLVKKGQLERASIQLLAKKIAYFHKDIAFKKNQPVTKSDKLILESVKIPFSENFSQIKTKINNLEILENLLKIESWGDQQSNILEKEFLNRYQNGFVRECHGDLHMKNIAIIDNDVIIFDCLEFSVDLRWIDTISELAFILMDLEDKNNESFSNCLLNTYLEYSGDYCGLNLLKYYKVYRALVRAKVNIIKATENGVNQQDKRALLTDFKNYLSLALRYTKPYKLFLAITYGVSGTGKSTKSGLIAESTMAIRIRSDVERKRLFGLAPDQKSYSTLNANIYSDQASDKTFSHLLMLSEKLLILGYPVIVDATFLDVNKRDDFRSLSHKLGIPFIIFDCIASQKEIYQRLDRRKNLDSEFSEANRRVMLEQLKNKDKLLAREKKYTLSIPTIERFNPRSLEHLL